MNARAVITQSAMVYCADKLMENSRIFWIIKKSNRPHVSMVYRLINHLRCWKDTAARDLQTTRDVGRTWLICCYNCVLCLVHRQSSACAETCEFGTLKDDLVRDRIRVCGVRDNGIPRNLLQQYTLNVWSRRKQLVLFCRESWCFPRRSPGKHQDSRENKAN